ncbi:MAG: hypothetical protein AAFU49_12890 [Pseudomonadota bacterium]
MDTRPREGQTQYDIREIYDAETGVLRIRQVRLNGKLHSPPSDEPSHAAYDSQGRPISFDWHNEGVHHRTTGPSTIIFDVPSGIHAIETFELYGEPRPRALGPWVICRDRKTNEISKQEYAQDPPHPGLDEPSSVEPG